MNEILGSWLKEYLGNKQAIALILVNFTIVILVYYFGKIFTPILIAAVLSFMMQGPINVLHRYLSYKSSCILAFTIFTFINVVGFVTLIPALWQQGTLLTDEIPNIIQSLKGAVDYLFSEQLSFISPAMIDQALAGTQNDLSRLSKNILQFSFSSIPSVVVVLIYFILVPLVMFFFNIDKDKIGQYLASYLPKETAQLKVISDEILRQFSNYIRGKIYQILVIGVVTCVAFRLLALKYAILLGTLVGLSVLVPYVGATLVTIPVVTVAFFQWGLSSEFSTTIIVYFLIQILDGNVLVPLLFSEAVSLHPLTIILAVLFFGYLGGLWGIFFAIPLAAICNAYLNFWPKTSRL